MKVGSGGNLGLCREISKKLFGNMINSWCNFPLMLEFLYKLSSGRLILLMTNSELRISTQIIPSRNFGSFPD